MLYISSDHGGFNLKSELIKYFSQNKIEFEDLGPTELVLDDDYNEYVLRLVERVRANKGSNGILLCRNGVGVSVLANKFKGIRAALSFDSAHAASSRNDDRANVLALPADYIDAGEALKITQAWLTTPFSTEERHVRRISSEDKYGQE